LIVHLFYEVRTYIGLYKYVCNVTDKGTDYTVLLGEVPASRKDTNVIVMLTSFCVLLRHHC